MRVFAAIGLLAAADALDCSGSTNKTDCGFMGITQDSCVAKGCCWVPVSPNPNNDPWCIYKGSPTPTTPTPATPAPGPSPATPTPATPAPGPGPAPAGDAPFSVAEQTTMKGFFFKNINIQGSGLVVAAPDYNTKGGSYYYHWMRDGGLTMRSVLNNFGWSEAQPLLKAYLTGVQRDQSESDPNGIDVRGEPKFMIPDGSVFTGGWCRPQNDGVGIRAGTLSLFGLRLIADGQSDLVKSAVWPAVQKDLEYAGQVWDQTGCDLWEEVRANDFYWQWANTRHGYLAAAQLATKLGDSSSAQSYQGTASAIASKMQGHTQNGFIFETSCCNRQKDVAGLLGALHDDPSTPVFGLASSEVANTISTLDAVFTQMFPINANGAKLWGRYEGDHYAGGNPWVLACAGRAQALYRGATAMVKAAHGGEALSADSLAAWRRVVNSTADTAQLATALVAEGDAVLKRVHDLVAPLGFHLPEQLDKSTGALANVHDLTWSYAATFDALRFRNEYHSTLSPAR
eukprot:Hpha_TRINITY_DN16684_c0_g1::TRINITY_DN16684_c0_g1_i8::g.181381::m.181381/K01178/SGA1; glucoamylase